MESLSIIVPVYNEEANVASLHAELAEVLQALGCPFEIIFINDGSTDGTLSALKRLPGITIIDFYRNYGQTTALDAGFRAAQNDIVISLDGDGQNDPKDIPRLLAYKAQHGLDVVTGWRQVRSDARSIKILTVIGRLLRHLFIADPVHDSGCTLRVYTREAAQSLDIGGEMHRYILTLLRWKGFRIGEIPVNHRPRTAGVSKYGASKALRGFIDLLYVWFLFKYSQRPLHLYGYLAFASFGASILSALWTLYNYIALGVHFARDVWVVVSLFFFLAALLFFSFGIVIELLLRIQLNTSPIEKRYYIRDTIRT